MKSKALAWCLIVIVGLVTFSCNKEDHFLSVDLDHVDASPGGESVRFTVSSNLNWAVSVPSWIVADIRSGNGEQEVTLTISPNVTDAERSTVVVISVADVFREEINITQGAIIFAVNTYDIRFDTSGTPQTVTVTSNGKWTLDIPDELDWLKADILSGDGDAVVTLTPTPYADRVIRDGTIIFTCYTIPITVGVSQEAVNESPTAPVLLTPENSATDVQFPIYFSWNPSVDTDGDVIYYDLFVSEDGQSWSESLSQTTENSLSISGEVLTALTNYYWKIVASDIFGGKSESDVYRFVSAQYEFIQDGTVMTHQTALSGGTPLRLVVMGDGFINHDYVRGGAFDQIAERAIAAFFSVEPFPTYRNYFEVHTVVAHSQERGATVKADFYDGSAKSQYRNTVFSTVFDGGQSTGISCDDDAVFRYAQKVPGISEEELTRTTIIVIVNLNVYAGTATMYKTGESIAMCPIGNYFDQVVNHEAGGHAFGRLYDEYIYYPAVVFPEIEKEHLNEYRNGNPWRFGANLSLTNNSSQVHWNHYFGIPDYSRVGLFEGGGLYGRGIWRPEENSCMGDATTYLTFNAPSREAIVRRMMTDSGIGFNFEAFIAKDNNTFLQVSSSRLRENLPPLGRPILK